MCILQVFLFASLISAVDPVAVLAIFSEVPLILLRKNRLPAFYTRRGPEIGFGGILEA
jgi:pseudouridine-5'-phosphate glycosidase